MHHFSVHSCCLNTLFYPIIFLILFDAASTTNQISNYIDHPFGGIAIETSNSRKLLSYKGDVLAINPSLSIENFRLKNAYIALQAWKEVILSDPHNITQNWVGSNVCNYTGVFCSPSLDQPSELTVSGIDINHGDIAGKLPHELGLLFDIALIHINSNRFCGTIPESFLNLKLLFELDLSNNRFVGKFPDVVVQMPNLKFLDLRFNEFEGALPKQLFERDLDALFINNNRFSFELPDNFGNSPVSVMVLANNNLVGCVPVSIGKMVRLNELLLLNNKFHSCLPNEIGMLKNVTVFDISYNEMMGTLPDSIGGVMSLEQLNLGHNMFSGMISSNICTLPNLENFVYEHNYFSEESPACLNLNAFADQQNCLRGRPMQRSALDCQRFLSNEVDCTTFKCALPPSPPLPLPSPPPTTPPQNNCCICLPPPSPSPLPSTEPPSSPLPLPAPSASPSPPSISPSPSSPQPPDLPSPSFVEPPLPSPLPCENQRIPSSQDMSSPSP
ncbi:hypothetical protein KY290_029136 [Solanum tuberosum]|uniref:Cell wall hydroxyproline-rich glycoprotein n=1 Tax=Solanum tuberosum TaxID=4113 RepID=A0ABQ7ULI6_SOLTU|nr:hypothetical protein KY290_029136 [Solanum tuberosum]